MTRRAKDFWKNLAKCAGGSTDLFFSDNKETIARAKRVCAHCVVRDNCLAAGMDEDFGIWGGLTARERKALRSEQVAREAG